MKCTIRTVFQKCTILEWQTTISYFFGKLKTNYGKDSYDLMSAKKKKRIKKKNPPLALLTCPVSLGRWWILVHSPCLLTECTRQHCRNYGFLLIIWTLLFESLHQGKCLCLSTYKNLKDSKIFFNLLRD